MKRLLLIVSVLILATCSLSFYGARAQQTVFVPLCSGTNDTAAFQSIIAGAASNARTIKIPYKSNTAQRCALNTISIPSYVTLDGIDGSGIKINAGQTVTVQGPIINPVGKTLWFGTGTVSYSGNSFVGTSGYPLVSNAGANPAFAQIGDAGVSTLSPSKITGTAVVTADPRIPTQNENDALVGTSGGPSSANKYVTDSDSRNINTRTPTDNTVSTAKVVDLAVTNGKIANSTIDLTTKVTGVLPGANGGWRVYNVTQSTFGAVGDGVTDDGAAIRAAVAASEAAGGGEVVLPGGNYLITSASAGALITLTKNVTFRCTGGASLLMGSAINGSTDFVLVKPGSNYVMDKLQITGCRFRPASGSPGRYGINIDVSTANSQIREASIDHNIIGNPAGFSGPMLEFGSYGISVTNPGSLSDSLFTGSIEHNWIAGGLNLVNIGDQYHVDYNVVASLVADRKSLILSALAGTAEHTVQWNSFTAGGGVQVLRSQTLQFIGNFIEMDNGSLTVSTTKMLDLSGATGTIIKPRIVANTFNAGALAVDAIILDHVTQAHLVDNNICVPAGRYLWKETANSLTNKYGDVVIGCAGTLVEYLGTNPGTDITLWQNFPPVTQAGHLAISGRMRFEGGYDFGNNAPRSTWGGGSPEGVVPGCISSEFHRLDGGAGTSFYIKESGICTSTTGWVAK
jgi:hypothetical protein